jgi:hypothetical protein
MGFRPEQYFPKRHRPERTSENIQSSLYTMNINEYAEPAPGQGGTASWRTGGRPQRPVRPAGSGGFGGRGFGQGGRGGGEGGNNEESYWIKCVNGRIHVRRRGWGPYYVTSTNQQARTVQAADLHDYLNELIRSLGGRAPERPQESRAKKVIESVRRVRGK